MSAIKCDRCGAEPNEHYGKPEWQYSIVRIHRMGAGSREREDGGEAFWRLCPECSGAFYSWVERSRR